MVLATTHETQGKRKNDFCNPPEGELVTFGSQCDGGTVDDRCGCRRSMTGLASLSATTTMKVAKFEGTADDIFKTYRQFYVRGGWDKLMQPHQVEKAVVEDVKNILRITNGFSEGTILERRGSTFRVRERSGQVQS